MKFVSSEEIRSRHTWQKAIDAMEAGHRGPRPMIEDFLLEQSPHSLFARGVILPGRGAGVKIASIFPPNVDQEPPRPAEDAAYIVIDEESKAVRAVMDGLEITR